MSYIQRPYANGNTNTNGNTNVNGNPSYTNGTTNQPRLARFDFDTTPETSADERSRSRGPGFGGFSTHPNPQIRAPSHLERQQAHRRSRDYGYGHDGSSRSHSRGAPTAATARYGTRGNEVEDTLRYISQHWSFMASEDCIPIKVALQLMDPSSLGLADQYDQFQEVHQHLQSALKLIVNEHHQGFNSSIGTFHKIQAAIHASQYRVRTLRAGLVQAKASLSTARPDLRAYATSSQGYDRMLQVIADIEQLQSIPDMLDAQISEKRFLGAVDTLQEGLALVRRPEMEDIGALSELKLRLSNQEQFLSDHLIEELHNHLYLKSPYCEERWKAHSDQDTASNNVLTAEHAMYVFLETYDGREPMQEDPTRNPEADSFYYIQVLVESLNSMGRLDAAVDEIERRLPVELFKVVERSHSEVEQRHPATMRSAAAAARQRAGRRVGAGIDVEQRVTLEDLLTTLYAKFEAIAEGHRVLHDVTGAILKREAQADGATLNRSFRELWKLLQSEIRSLLHDHLTMTGAGIGGQRHKENDPNANMFRPQPRDKTKKLFKISAADSTKPSDTKFTGATDVLATEKEDLMNMLKDSVPGLVNTSQAQQAHKLREAELAMADKSATGHKLLVEPSLFNMSVLLPPSISFLHRLRDIVPPAASSGVVAHTSTSFLDEFLINVFYPQLDETLTELCSEHNNAAGSLSSGAFQPDPKWREYSSRPILRGAVRFHEILEMVCEMLDALPHEQGFSLLVIREMRGWYERCFGWSKGLLQRAVGSPVAGGDVQMAIRLAAELATSGDVNEVVIELLKVEEKERVVLAEKESALLIQIVKDRGVEEADLIRDRKALAALCTLHVSMKWLAARCQSLRYISPRALDTGDHHSPAGTQQHHHHNHHVRRWTSTSAQQPGSSLTDNEPTSVYLPLDQHTATQFDAVLTSFTELSALILRTLHVDMRLHLLHGVSQALTHSYELGTLTPGHNAKPSDTPDPSILDLSSALSSYDAVISEGLLPPQYAFLTRDLHVLGNNAFVSASMLGLVKGRIDDPGFARMQLNILVLQQAVKNLDTADSSSLRRAGAFFALGEEGCEAIVMRGRQEGFDAEELRVLVGLCWQEGRDERGGVEQYVGMLTAAEGSGGAAAGAAGFPRRKASLRRGKSGGG
ncbi:exocyst subunit [Friedmanniomyces endolithicus]|nr:exocyst subunit [Friedmanniomyces endolithicus]KAK0826652.1 exocyst subunit [Friedmanniomyces endolithicus]